MTDVGKKISRRDFLLHTTKAAIGIGVLSSVPLLASCASNKKSDSSSLAALRVSSDPYKTDLEQRFAFSIFNGSQVAAQGNIKATLESPSGKVTKFNSVPIRDKGIPDQGIYSIPAILNEVGSWKLETNFEEKKLDLSFSVNETSSAPALSASCPSSITPTKSNPLDASILCTRFEGECELHNHSVDELLKKQKPFVVIFATPARCQTSYCGPVLDLTREVAKTSSLDVIHIEIYKNETTNDTLDAVKNWNLPSEPWVFGVNGDGKIDWRLDGAFDKSEVEELFNRLT